MAWEWADKLGDSLVNAGSTIIDGFAEAQVEHKAPEPTNTANLPAQKTNDANIKFSDVAALAALEKQKADAAENADKNKPFIEKYGLHLAVGGGSLLVVLVLVVALKGGKR